jgi:hypothetical protein
MLQEAEGLGDTYVVKCDGIGRSVSVGGMTPVLASELF